MAVNRRPARMAADRSEQRKEHTMADNSVAYVAVYDDVNSALADLDTLGEMHDDDLVGKYDAAVIDEESGKPTVVRRVDRPRINVLPDLVGGGALPRGALSADAKG